MWHRIKKKELYGLDSSLLTAVPVSVLTMERLHSECLYKYSVTTSVMFRGVVKPTV